MFYQMLTDISWVVNLRSPFLTPIFEFLTWLGYRDFLFMFIPFTYWCFDRKIFGRLVLIVFFSAIINSWLKDFFQDPRPDLYLNIDPWLQAETSFGFPSGHTQIAVVIWLYIALNVKNLFAKIVSIIFLLGVPFSRIYLGVHDIGDILGGMIVGLFTLYAAHLFYQNIDLGKYNLNKLFKYVLTIILLIVFYLSWPMDHGHELVTGLGGLILGFMIGSDLDKKYFGYERVSNTFMHYFSCSLALIVFLILNKFLETGFDQVILPEWFEIGMSSFILGAYISFITLFLLSKVKLQSIK